ncbi:hypothetical protein [Bradyrhizobium tunisiense]|uniref:hypothetical protein n=1 Tax=Bradyrhizobium tunisiense TaxID=3278709 RepID=UPI0035E38DC3
MSSDAAHVLFPSDAPKAPAVAAPSAAGASPQADAAALLFPTEVKAAVPVLPPATVEVAKSEVAKPDIQAAPAERDSIERLDVLAEAVRLGGDADRAAALTETGNVLLTEALAHGMPSADLQEIVGHVHEASSTLSPMTAEQNAEGMVKGMADLADVPAADLDLARGLIQQMSEKMPALPYQLEATGLGNRPEFIRAVIREAKRRSGGSA